MIKELVYEWVLFSANILGCKRRSGFYDNRNIYEKKGWLKWEKRLISNVTRP